MTQHYNIGSPKSTQDYRLKSSFHQDLALVPSLHSPTLQVWGTRTSRIVCRHRRPLHPSPKSKNGTQKYFSSTIPSCPRQSPQGIQSGTTIFLGQYSNPAQSHLQSHILRVLYIATISLPSLLPASFVRTAHGRDGVSKWAKRGCSRTGGGFNRPFLFAKQEYLRSERYYKESLQCHDQFCWTGLRLKGRFTHTSIRDSTWRICLVDR